MLCHTATLDGITLTEHDEYQAPPLLALQVDVGTGEVQTLTSAALRRWCPEKPESYAVEHDERFVMILFRWASGQGAAVGIWDTTAKRWVDAGSNRDAGCMGMLFDAKRSRFIGIDRVRTYGTLSTRLVTISLDGTMTATNVILDGGESFPGTVMGTEDPHAPRFSARQSAFTGEPDCRHANLPLSPEDGDQMWYHESTARLVIRLEGMWFEGEV